MRSRWIVVLLLVATIGLTACLTVFAVRHFDVKPILVKVDGAHVHFRRNKPESLPKPIKRYAGQGEAFVADAKESGPSESPGQTGDWYHLTNVATNQEGWVFGTYVAPIHLEDAERLKRLGPYRLAENLPGTSLQNSSYVLAAVAALLTISAEISRLLRRRRPTFKTVTHSAAPANIIPFRSRSAQEPSQIVYGVSGGSPWLYRPKARHHGGAA